MLSMTASANVAGDGPTLLHKRARKAQHLLLPGTTVLYRHTNRKAKINAVLHHDEYLLTLHDGTQTQSSQKDVTRYIAPIHIPPTAAQSRYAEKLQLCLKLFERDIADETTQGHYALQKDNIQHVHISKTTTYTADITQNSSADAPNLDTDTVGTTAIHARSSPQKVTTESQRTIAHLLSPQSTWRQALADSGAARSVIDDATYVHDIQEHIITLGDAGHQQHFTTHRGFVQLRCTPSFVLHLPVVVCPSIPGLIVNTTDLHQRQQYTGTISKSGTMWRNPHGAEYTCPIQDGQEYFLGNLIRPRQVSQISISHTPDSQHDLPVDTRFRTDHQDDDIATMLEHLRTQQYNVNQEDYLRTRLAHLGCVTTKGDNDKYLELHCRLGHRSVRDTLKVAAYLQIPVGKYAAIVCDMCQLAKSKRTPVRHATPSPHKYANFEAWHVDAWGPHQHRSLFGKHRYVLAFIDRATRTAIPIFIPALTAVCIAEATTQFANIVTHLRADAQHHGIKITLGPRVTTDSAQYFKTTLVNRAFRQAGLTQHYYSPPYTQANNGLIERWFGTTASSAAAMLQASGLAQEMWPEAFRHAAYIYDITPHSALGISPYEARTGSRPQATDLHIWGSRAWCWIDKAKRRKGQPTGKPGYYMGYHARSGSHLVHTKDKGNKDTLTNAYHIVIDDKIPDKVIQGVIPCVPDSDNQPEITLDMSPTHQNAILSVDDISNSATRSHREVTHYSHRSAKNDPTWGKYFHGALDKEVGELIRMKALVPIAYKDIQADEKIHSSTCLYTIKQDQTGRYTGKCRLVFSGRGQTRGMDYDLKSSHHPQWATIRLHLGLTPVRQHGQVLALIDIKKAYVRTKNYTPSGRRVIIKLPIDAAFTDDSGVTWQYMIVDSALYGQVNAGYLWQQCLWTYMRHLGWTQCVDRCTWIKDGARILIWTDDIIFRGTHRQQEHLVHGLNAKFPGCSVTDGTKILGHRVTPQQNGTYALDSQAYITDIAAKHGVTTFNKTPLPAGITLHRDKSEAYDTARTTEFKQMTGSITYLASTTRPDIAFAASALGQVAQNPTKTHVKLAKRTIGYLLRTATYSLTPTQTPSERQNRVNTIVGYVDASYADGISYKSQTGFVIFLNNSPIAWKSKCQRYVSLSTQESEVVAACDAAREIQFLRAVLHSWSDNIWRTNPHEPTILYEDNESAITFFETGLITNRNKHFGTKLEHVRRLIADDKVIELRHISTKDQIADVFTKSLANNAQKFHTDKMLHPRFLQHTGKMMTVSPTSTAPIA